MCIWKNMPTISFLCNVEKNLKLELSQVLKWCGTLCQHIWMCTADFGKMPVYFQVHMLIISWINFCFHRHDVMRESWAKSHEKKIISEFLIGAFAPFLLDCQWKNLPWTKDHLAFVMLKSAWTMESSRKHVVGRLESGRKNGVWNFYKHKIPWSCVNQNLKIWKKLSLTF